MAANLRNSILASFGKRFVSQIRSRDSVVIPSLSTRSVHVSVYDKDPEDHVLPVVVPDYLIPAQPDKYWAPHPQTGVFGPATDHNLGSGGERGLHATAGANSVLEQKAFFRPLEDLDKPVQP